MADLSTLLNALPAASAQHKQQKAVSLLDALPDPSLVTAQMDYESRPSLLASNLNAMSAAAEFAVLTHKKAQETEDAPSASSSRRKRVKADAVPKSKKVKRARGKEVKQRSRGNQRG